VKRLAGWALAWIGFLALLYAIWTFNDQPRPWALVLAVGVVVSVIMMQGLRIVDRNPRKTKLTK
jgi:peptidoglycan/LPS O-acetylase OafA/YrhL